MRAIAVLPLLLLLSCWSSNSEPAPPGPPVRFVDLDGSKKAHVQKLGMTSKRVLDPGRSEHSFALPKNLPRDPVLDFSIATDGGPEPASFEILLRSADGPAEPLYKSSAEGKDWEGQQIRLAGRDLEQKELVFRSQGDGAGFWGTPTLLPDAVSELPSVILISVDTLRADRVGAYGAQRQLTPGLDRLATEGVRYDKAYSSSFWTIPSHMSLFTGMHPHSPKKHAHTLAEVFREAGYLTAGFTGGGWLAMGSFPRGFDTYFTYKRPKKIPGHCLAERLDGPEVFAEAVEWMRRHRNVPFFLFLHTYDPHDHCGVLLGEVCSDWPAPALDGRLAFSDYYEDRVRETDARLADLFRELDDLGLSERTVVIVTSDHGESFWENEQFAHQCTLKPYEHLVRVPLIVRYPARLPAGKTVSTPVSATAVAPTLLSLLDLPREPQMEVPPLPGLDLAGVPGKPAPVYTHCGDNLGVIEDEYKLITSRNGSFSDEVYNLSLDSTEDENLAGQMPEVEARLHALADRYWQGVPDAPEPTLAVDEIDEATREQLRALGYLD